MVEQPTEPEQLGLLQVEEAQRDKATTKKMRPRTKKESAIIASFVERFIAGKEIDNFPTAEEDLAEEAAEPESEPTIWLALTKQIGRAFVRSATPPSQTASFFASMLLKSRDPKFERDVLVLPAEAIRPDRILAHVQSMPIKLEPRVALAVARRTCLILWNQDKWVSKGAAASASAPVAAPEPTGVSDAAEPGDEEMCMDCGDVYIGEHACAPAAPRPKTAEPEPKPDNSKAEAALAARRCIGYTRSKVAQLFSVSQGIGKEPEYITMPEGEVLEVLEPNEHDEADRVRAQKVHQHLLVIVRWRGKSRVLIHKTVERATRAEWDEQEAQRGS